MRQPITRIKATNFRSLAEVDIPLSPLTVLIGPNGSGKTNMLSVLRFLATTSRFDLTDVLREWGCWHVQRQAPGVRSVRIEVEGQVTQHASTKAPEAYLLQLIARNKAVSRTEEFSFPTGGQGRCIKVSGATATVVEDDHLLIAWKLADSHTTGLATLPKLSDENGGLGIRRFAEFLARVRILEPDVAAVRQPGRPYDAVLADDASNLADALSRLRLVDEDAWHLLTEDVRRCLPGLLEIELAPVGEAAGSVEVWLVEHGVVEPIAVADASFGTVRLLTLLTALHEPHSVSFLAVEEVDHELHPYALDVLVDRVRAATCRTQILAATHSPTLLNRLEASEIMVCDRDPDTSASIISAVSASQLRAALAASEWRAGELWFSGAIHGVPA